jgi:hypothetical protein
MVAGIDRSIDVGDIANSQTDKVTAAQFAVGGEPGQRKIADSSRVLKVGPDGPNIVGPQRRLLRDQLAFVTRLMGLFGLHGTLAQEKWEFHLARRSGEGSQSCRLLPQ